MKEGRLIRLCTAWFHSYGILEKAKEYEDRERISGWQGFRVRRALATKGQDKKFGRVVFIELPVPIVAVDICFYSFVNTHRPARQKAWVLVYIIFLNKYSFWKPKWYVILQVCGSTLEFSTLPSNYPLSPLEHICLKGKIKCSDSSTFWLCIFFLLVCWLWNLRTP